MEKNKSWIKWLSLLLFALGVAIGTTVTAINTWGDLEAGMFDTLIQGEESISSLKCPAMITTSETATVSASFTNTHVRSLERNIRVHISDGNATLMREEQTKLPLTPGKTEKLQWIVNPEDAAFDQFVLVRVYLFPKPPLPAQDGSCGIMVVNIPSLAGNLIMSTLYIASILFLALGAFLWVAHNRPLRAEQQSTLRSIMLLTVSVVAGMVVSYLGWWFAGVICLAITLILVFSIPTQLAAKSQAVPIL
jgi:hypothetical protein